MGNHESEPQYQIPHPNLNQKYRITYHNYPNAPELLRIFRLFTKEPYHFIRKIDIQTETHNCCDRTILKVTTPLCPFTLDTLLGIKRKMKGFFVEKQIWYIIKSIINILAFMQINGIVLGVFHPSFFYLDQGRFLATQVLHLLPGNQHENNYSIHNYYSPEKLGAITNDLFNERPIDLFKSEVFSFGLLILQVATCPLSKPKFHKTSMKQMVWSQILARSEIVHQRYSEKLSELLEMVLREDVRIRPDWNYLRIWMLRNEPLIDVAPCIFWTI